MIKCQEEYTDYFPLSEDQETLECVKSEVKENLMDPDKLNKIVEDYDLFDTGDLQWMGFISLLKMYK